MSTADDIAHAARLIRAGRLVVFPTETVYGLGANALDSAAVERIFTAKRRPHTSPLIVHVDSIEMACEVAAAWPDAAEVLARRYWPGPLTLVLPKRGTIPDIVTAGLKTVGLRMPAHPMALDLIRAAGVPVAAPSANRFTELSPTAAAHVGAEMADYVLDGGPAQVGIESTVLSLVDSPVLLRPGVIPLPEIEALIGRVEIAGAPEAGAHPSPGMHARHYQPRTPLYLVATRASDTLSGTTYQKSTSYKEKPDSVSGIEGRGAWLRIGHEMPADPLAYAAALYETLHRLDAQGFDWIAVERPPETPEWAGVLDRLRRAASGDRK